jgi:hypothetical protein
MVRDRRITGGFGGVLVAAVLIVFGYTLSTFAVGILNQASHEAPKANFDFSYEGDRIVVTHSTGDIVPAEKLHLAVDNQDHGNYTFKWENASTSPVTSGDTVVVGEEGTDATFTVPFTFEPGDEVRVVFEDESGKVVLSEYTVPNNAGRIGS